MVVPKPKDVVQLGQEIIRLEGQLAEAKRKWNLLLGIQVPEKRTRASSPDGLTAKVLQYIEESTGKTSSITATAQAVSEDELPVGRTLYRLAKAGKIANPSRGLYTSLNTAKEEEVSPIVEETP